jgi:DNA-directed RNA polymerase specialized sigma24 family protein
MNPEMREKRVLTQRAFSQLLEWLDDGVHSHGETYLEMRRRLVAYFDRRNCLTPDELADEALNRIARTLEESGVITITPPARYCYVVARFVLLEDIRQRKQNPVSLDAPRIAADGPALDARQADSQEILAHRERRFDCLELCLGRLKPAQRELIVEYYRDSRRQKIERRRGLAERLGITMNALGIRACRIREALEACVQACCREG